MEIPVEIGLSARLGIRGLVAARDIVVGEVIERCPTVLFPVEQEPLIEATAMGNYYFRWDEAHYAFALGYGSLYNHSYRANVEYTRDFAACQILFTAVKPIRCGEEMTVNYNGSADDPTPLDVAVWGWS